MSLDFGVIEGLAFGDLVYIIATELFGVEAVASAVGSVGAAGSSLIAFTESFIGAEGIEAIMNIVKGVPSFLEDAPIDPLQMTTQGKAIFEELSVGYSLNPKFTFNDFMVNMTKLGSSLQKNGLNMSLNSSKDFVASIIKSSVLKAKSSLKKGLTPGAISSAIVGTYIGNAAYNKFLDAGKKGVKNVYNKAIDVIDQTEPTLKNELPM